MGSFNNIISHFPTKKPPSKQYKIILFLLFAWKGVFQYFRTIFFLYQRFKELCFVVIALHKSRFLQVNAS